MEPGPVGDDGLHPDDRAAAQIGDGGAIGVDEGVEAVRLEDQPLDHRLEAKDLFDPNGRERSELVERIRRVAAVARVDEPRLEVRPGRDLTRKPLDAALAARGVNGVGCRLAVEQERELAHRPLIEDRRRDMVPGDLREVRLGQMDPESVVVRRLRPEQRVAMVVDDRDRVEIERHRAMRIST